MYERMNRPVHKPMPYLCMGLSRLFGGIAFLVVSFGMFNKLNDKWDLGIKHMMDISSTGGKAYLALVLSMFVGLIALVIGQIIGASIRVKNEDLACHITITWHYVAITSLIWLFMAPIPIAITLGKVQSKVFFESFGDAFFIMAFIVAAVGGMLISLAMTISGKVGLKIDRGLGNLLSRMLPITIGIAMGIFQLSSIGFPIIGGVIIGFMLPYLLIPIASIMWRRDMARRNPAYIHL